ncbi:probable GTP-binding protein OBGM, mitochondrial isoform X1 [Amborella trichopoda]|uniref:OBG-type G domain-containing protein n=1 Tax=Amborella trichopoda TaxID=13333 RepID=W1PNW2_AMBTC|nr:probable GTP-binding protein OBGM, mitochondrial isoform X1 [Amborella trichopoda]XP_020525153.1 probable GTP-binding protein OBGM, mitochondrial isoform X1 [Amborella trichopoda]XP_020525154.1 probable GTP-binding protein OBGM, mitochondrial isoform X1 [Amborella trichopoda]XP_020525155.1 probable GTP-binding protein OBGM, mitochondrial isoform X1 [Amborella trichopoda]XP_020525156.1 probable GTP-binding protein OBGM, mitochondrial isoform X1 [Amborella trichopoda]XP_020525157.1 probable G|eukprot:XP_006848162.1 probable GTP-binding protein OBGM, mitochondrial isoform X1 [Amborella trichopoda]
MWARLKVFRSDALRYSNKSRGSAWNVASFHYLDVPKKKGKVGPLQERRMVDRSTLWVKGGEGGKGCWSYRRSRHDRRGKPDGGNGGRGGDVILECSPAIWDLSNLQHHLNAKRGGNGLSKNKVGSRGADKVAQVPVGTVIHLVRGSLPSLEESIQSPTRSPDLAPWELPGAVGVETDIHTHTVESKKEKHYSKSLNVDQISTANELESKTDEEECFSRISKGLHELSFKSDEGEDFPKISKEINGLDLKADEEEYCSYSEEDVENDDEEVQSDYMEMSSEEEEAIQYSVAEFTKPGQRIVVAQGGEGGWGNTSFVKVSKRTKTTRHEDVHPINEISDEEISSSEPNCEGQPGSEAHLILELKSIADVGLVGMPNAGKSTLLGAISRAKPRVGHYAFTTLRPNIGNLHYEDYFSVSVADIPGLIKGAHENRGLGHAFLRHIERTKVIAYVVDLSAALDGRKGIPPWEQLRDLVMELESHQPGLSDRPSLIVANKIDEDGTDCVLEELKGRVKTVPIYPICAVLQEGITELKTGLRKLVNGEEVQRLELSAIMVD